MQGAVKSASAHNAVSLWVSMHTFDSLAILLFHFHFWLRLEKSKLLLLRQQKSDTDIQVDTRALFGAFYICVGCLTADHNCA